MRAIPVGLQAVAYKLEKHALVCGRSEAHIQDPSPMHVDLAIPDGRTEGFILLPILPNQL